MTTIEELLRSNVRNSISILNDGPFPVPSGWPSGQPHFYGGLSFSPAFYGSKGDVRCFQGDVFGFYALRAGVRGALLAVNYLTAATHLANIGHHGPSVLCAYTCAFQCLHSWLALYGRVFPDPVYWWTTDLSPRPHDVVAVLATLSKSSKWSFHTDRRSHGRRWSNLREIVTSRHEALPQYFEIAFDALFDRGRCPRQTLDDLVQDGPAKAEPLSAVLREPARFSPRWSSAEEVLKDFLWQITEVRHGALYASSGDDPFLTNALLNGDAVTGDLGAQAKSLCAFAAEMLLDVSQQWRAILDIANPSVEVLKWLNIFVHFPLFDRPKIQDLQPSRLRDATIHLSKAIDPR